MTSNKIYEMWKDLRLLLLLRAITTCVIFLHLVRILHLSLFGRCGCMTGHIVGVCFYMPKSRG